MAPCIYLVVFSLDARGWLALRRRTERDHVLRGWMFRPVSYHVTSVILHLPVSLLAILLKDSLLLAILRDICLGNYFSGHRNSRNSISESCS